MFEIAIVALLAGILSLEGYRMYLAIRPTSRKKHMQDRLRGTRNMIWDLQFKVFKTREIREEIRQEYDQMKSRIATLDERIKNWPKDKDEGDRKRLEDDKVRVERDAGRFLKQMQGLDLEVEGSKPTQELPDGHQGITDQIDSLRELEGMLKDYIRGL